MIYYFSALSTHLDLLSIFSKYPLSPEMTCDLLAMCPCAGTLMNTQNSGRQQLPSNLQVSTALPGRTAVNLHQWEQYSPQKHPESGAFAEEMC